MRIFPAGGSYSGAVRPVSECGVSYLLITREMDYTLRVLRALYREGQLSAASVARNTLECNLRVIERMRASQEKAAEAAPPAEPRQYDFRG